MYFSVDQEVAGYIIKERIQDANLGMVYRVQHRTLESQHYLKCVREKSINSQQKRDDYIGAMQLMSSLRHPCLVRITDVVVSESQCGIVMDLVEGHDIIRMMAEDVGHTQIGQWICQALCGLQFLHEHDILHLRIHPRNVLIEVERNGELEGRLLDGGYPTGLPEPRTFHYYRAPECWGEAPQSSIQSDVFSMGVVLYELLCDTRPFQGDDPSDILDAMLAGEFIPPRKHNSRIPKKLETVIMKSLSAFIGGRQQSAKDFFNELQSALGKDAAVNYDELAAEAEEIEPAACQDISNDIPEPEPEPEIIVDEIPEGLNFQHPPPETVIELDERGSPLPNQSFYDSETPPQPKKKSKTPKKNGTQLISKTRIFLILGLILAIAMYVFFPRSRNVVLIIDDKPIWGQLRLKINEQKMTLGNGVLSDVKFGQHQLSWSGGVFENGSCVRCCWESEGNLQVNFGIGELAVPMTLFPNDQARCPTDESGYQFSLTPNGSFQMGSSLEEEGRDLDEIKHKVELSWPLLVGQTEVTQQLYELVTSGNPSQNRHPNHPVETVSWDDAVLFCNLLSQQEGLDQCYDLSSRYVFMAPSVHCKGYRLPTEAEWEYAASAGQNTRYSGSDSIEAVAWIFTNANNSSHPVKGKSGNLWQLYDMSGNIQEWVWNNYIPYATDESLDPIGPADGSYRVLRGGGYTHNARRTRVHDRDKAVPRLRTPYIGFRIVRSVESAQ